MKKLVWLGVLAVFLFQPIEPWAWPLDVPYQILVTTTNLNSVVMSTTNFPSASSGVNSSVASYQWCVSHVVVSAATASTFTMFWSTSALTTGTTDYLVVTAANTPYNNEWAYRTPYCSPVGYPILTLKSSVAGSTVTAEGFLFKGWN